MSQIGNYKSALDEKPVIINTDRIQMKAGFVGNGLALAFGLAPILALIIYLILNIQ